MTYRFLRNTEFNQGKFILVLSSIVILVFLGFSMPDSFAEHEAECIGSKDNKKCGFPNKDKRMIVFEIHGNGGGKPDRDEEFVKWIVANNGMIHTSSWNSYHDTEIKRYDPNTDEFKKSKDTDEFKVFNRNVKTCDDGVIERCTWSMILHEYADYFDIEGQSGKRFMLQGFSLGGGSATFIATDYPNNSDVQFDMVWLLDPGGHHATRWGLEKICDEPLKPNPIFTGLMRTKALDKECSGHGKRIF